MSASSVVTPQMFQSEPAALAQDLSEFQRQLARMLPADAYARLAAAIDLMVATRPGAAALKIGQPAPDFVLPSLDGGTVALANELLAGPVVLTFYRGSWCPYCDLQLRAYAELVPLLRSVGARLLAVSPQSAEAVVPNASDHRSLGFPLLTDAGGEVARRYGLMYVLDDAMRSVMLGFGLDLSVVNGDASWELPVPATYVVSSDRRIAWAHVEDDYRRRAEPADILRAVRGLS
jgi:peroxiredoxin